MTGTATPSDPGDPIAKVMVNGAAATLAADGSFSAAITAPHGAMLLETVATTQSGASTTDTRAVQTGQLRAVGTGIDRAVTALCECEIKIDLKAGDAGAIDGVRGTARQCRKPLLGIG